MTDMYTLELEQPKSQRVYTIKPLFRGREIFNRRGNKDLYHREMISAA